jgi:hypothetical protein
MCASKLTIAAIPLLCAAVASFGCSSLDNTNFGPPGGLTGKKIPLPAGSDSGGSPPTDAGAADAGNTDCGVSWANQIFPQMAPTGSWRCADATSCHGGLQAPQMATDPRATYATLAAYTMQFAPQRLPYLLPGDSDPSKSGIECNLSSSTCGNRMPLVTSGARLLDSQEMQMIDIWVRCGSPDN